VRDVRQFSSSIAYRVKKKKEREKEREKDRFSLPFFAHFAFLHLLSSLNVLGVAAAAVVRRKNTDNDQRTIYVVVVVVIILSRRGEQKNEEQDLLSIFYLRHKNSINKIKENKINKYMIFLFLITYIKKIKVRH
jgi:hypothetical protein